MSRPENDSRKPVRPSATQQQPPNSGITDEELQQRIGTAVRVARVVRSMSQRELAAALGKSQNFIYTMEKGKTDPGVLALQKIAGILHVSVDLFLAPVLKPRIQADDHRREAYEEGQDLLVQLVRALDRKLNTDDPTAETDMESD